MMYFFVCLLSVTSIPLGLCLKISTTVLGLLGHWLHQLDLVLVKNALVIMMPVEKRSVRVNQVKNVN